MSFGGPVSKQDEITIQSMDWCSDTPPSLAGSREGPDSQRNDVKDSSIPMSTRWAAVLLSVPLLLIAVAAIVSGLLLRSHVSNWLSLAAFVTSAFFFLSGVVVPLGVIREKNLEREAKKHCNDDNEDLNWALSSIEDHTLKGLAWVNVKQLRTFTFIAQRQARMSYYASLVAAAIALLVITTGAAVVISLPTTAAQVTAGALATTAAALSGFFVRTFLSTYKMASRQMSYYYGQPLVHCYLLHGERLAREAGKHFGDAAEFSLLQELISASIKSSASAQHHLLNMQELEYKRHGTGSGRRPKKPQPGR
jgi:Cyanobacterial TRADD-N associated 2-Transmembrane domain